MSNGSGQVKPGVIALRPLTVGDILEAAVSTIRRYPAAMLGVSAIVVAISQLLILAATYPLLDDVAALATISPSAPAAELNRFVRIFLAYDGIIALITFPSRILLAGLLTVVVGKAVLGQKLARGELWGRLRPRLLPLVAVSLIYPVLAGGTAALLYVLTLAAPQLAVLVILVVIPVALWLYILFSFTTPALILEHAPIGRAFGRSRRLVTGSWWRVFGIQLLAALLALVVELIIGLPFGRNLAASTTGAIIAGTLTEPFAAAVTVLLYTDQRIRRERMDLELARAAGQ